MLMLEPYGQKGPEQEDGGSCGVFVLMALYWCLRGFALPTHFDVATARATLAAFLEPKTAKVSHQPSEPAPRSASNTKRMRGEERGEEVAEEPPHAKKHRTNGEGPAVECPPPEGELEERERILAEFALLESTIEESTARFQGLSAQFRQSNTIPDLITADSYLDSLPQKIARRRCMVKLAAEEHQEAAAAVETARSNSQSQNTPAGTDTVSGQPAHGTTRLLREAEEAEKEAHAEVKLQQAKDREMTNTLAEAQLAVELEQRREKLLGDVRKLLELVNQPWLPEQGIYS